MSKRNRGFELVTTMDGELPERSTKHSAGYDFKASEDIEIPSIFLTTLKIVLDKVLVFSKGGKLDSFTEEEHNLFKPTLVPTGVKAYMGEDEYLQVTNRSSNPIKNFLILTNGVGIVDSDYYNNESNEGHIMFQFINFGIRNKTIKKGDAIGQGIFLPFLKVDNEKEVTAERKGGHGSTTSKD